MAAPSPQLPLALRYPPDQRLETFFGTDGAAVAQVRAFARGDAGRSLLLVGAAGTGKTHLALAACAEADAAGRRAGYLPLASAAGRLRDALESLHALDLVALDGLEAAAGDRDDEVALFDFHNRMHDAGRLLLYTSRAAPGELTLVLPDLRSRLAQCARVGLERLDDAGRGEVLRLRAARRGLQMDAAAIDWLLRRAGRDLSGLAALLDRLDRASLAAQRRITVPFLREVLGTPEPG
ncbi:MAG: DnaA regulatory inactivator Hda [Luteimonas sp.]|nr:DnaA regulatory inactivator Hda [Luteimonas sp.]